MISYMTWYHIKLKYKLVAITFDSYEHKNIAHNILNNIFLISLRYGSDSGKGATWHPSKGFHLLRGEAISWHYVMATLDAIYMIQQDQKTMTRTAMRARTLNY